MQQSSATPSLHLDFWGLRKIFACSPSSSQCLLVPTVFGTVSSLHPISFLMIFILVYGMKKSPKDRLTMRAQLTYILEEFLEDWKLFLLLLHVSGEVFECDAWSVSPQVWLQATLHHCHTLIHQIEQRVMLWNVR